MKIWTAASWGEKCFSSEAFLESKALKLVSICAPQSNTKWGMWPYSVRYLKLQHQSWHTGASTQPTARAASGPRATRDKSTFIMKEAALVNSFTDPISGLLLAGMAQSRIHFVPAFEESSHFFSWAARRGVCLP